MSALAIFAVIAGIIGIVGSIVPGIPGPPISWIGLLLAFFARGLDSSGEPMTVAALFIWFAVVAIVTVMDYVIPAGLIKVTGGSKAAATGAIVGLFAGMFLSPVGMVAGSLLGAFLADFLIADRGLWVSFKSSIGAFFGFILGTGLKLIVSGVMMYEIVVFSF